MPVVANRQQVNSTGKVTAAAKPKRAPRYDTSTEENPEWTAERVKNAMRYPNLPPELMRLIEADKKQRGVQVAPKKQAISIRLSPDVLAALRATGPGWQARANAALRAEFVAK